MHSKSLLRSAALLPMLASCAPGEEVRSLSDLDSHIHDIAVDLLDRSSLLLATHEGLYTVDENGSLVLRSGGFDLKAVRPSPDGVGLLYASGHAEGSAGLGLLSSRDGGRSWARTELGLEQNEFHQIAISPTDSRTVYGILDAVYVSGDGGRTFSRTGDLPAGTVDVDVVAADEDILYAASSNGLFTSTDKGASWEQAMPNLSLTLVAGNSEGGVYIFALETGLLYADQPGADFELLSLGWIDHFAELTVDPTDATAVYAVTNSGRFVRSLDGGRTWQMFGT